LILVRWAANLFRFAEANPSHLLFEQLERFAVTAALEEMAELGIDFRRQGLFEELNFFGNFPKAFRVAVVIGATLLVADDGEAFAESGSEIG
jgi:hypothetical protein